MINAVMELGQILGQTSYRYSTTSSSDEAAGAIFGGAFFFCYLIVIVAIYIYMAICLSKIAEKAGEKENKIWAWIPFLNLLLMLKIAGKEMWWVILFFIPFVNIVVSVIVWMDLAEKVKHPAWLGILMVVPGVSIFVPGYLAFVEGKE